MTWCSTHQVRKKPHRLTCTVSLSQISGIGIKPATVKDRGVHDVLEKLQKYLKEHLGSTCTDIKLTDYAVTFLYRGELYVDLLPSPYWSTMEEFHHYLGTIEADERRQ